MPSSAITLSIPSFQGWIRRIVLACAGIYLLNNLLFYTISPEIYRYILDWFGLIPARVLHGFLWQLVTYSLLHGTLGHLVFNLLPLWMFGSQIEDDWGPKKFIEFYLFCVVGAGLVTILVALFGIGLTMSTPTIGASGGVYGVLIAFGMLYGDRPIFMFPLPFTMKAKYMVGIMIFFVLVATIEPSRSGVANFAHLGGLLFGFLYVKFMPRRGAAFGVSEKYFSARNAYYRWKRKRAARKFQVYMRKHDRNVSFDEQGNYVPPDENDKKNGGSKSGWVN